MNIIHKIIKKEMMILVIIFLLSVPSIATHGNHPASETPGSKDAVIFSPFGPLSAGDMAAMNYFENKVKDHNYDVTKYLDTTESQDDDPGGATFTNFTRLSQKGLVFVVTHGGILGYNKLLIEGYNTPGVRNTRYDKYLTDGNATAAEISKCDGFTDHMDTQTYGICINETGIQKFFKDKDTIVHIAACYSFRFVEKFNSREYFGYADPTRCDTNIRPDTELLWGRMHGEVDSGNNRAARIAFNAGGFTDIFRHRHDNNKIDTVLSPAVKTHYPLKDEEFQVPTAITGHVVFDTRMDITKIPIVTVSGCNATITNQLWLTPFTLMFDLSLNDPGLATLTAQSASAIAERDFKNNLDGNQNPAIDHVGPNRDDFVWAINCTREIIKVPTPDHETCHPEAYNATTGGIQYPIDKVSLLYPFLLTIALITIVASLCRYYKHRLK